MLVTGEINRLRRALVTMSSGDILTHRVHLTDTILQSIAVYQVVSSYYSIAFYSSGWSTHVINALDIESVIRLIESFDFNIYEIIMAIFNEHYTACEIALGNSNDKA